jgi:hypothetical protein
LGKVKKKVEPFPNSLDPNLAAMQLDELFADH